MAIRAVQVFLAIVLMLLCAGLSFGADKRINDATGLISFALPDDWAVSQERTEAESRIQAVSPSEEAFLAVSLKPMREGMSRAEWDEKIRATLAQKMTKPRFGPVKICDREALAVVGTSRDDPKSTLDAVALYDQEIGVIILMTYPTRVWQKYRPVLEKVVATCSCGLKD